jgi:hypothetical protein
MLRGKPYRLHHERDVVPEDGRLRRGVGSLILLHAGEIHTPASLQQTGAEEEAGRRRPFGN